MTSEAEVKVPPPEIEVSLQDPEWSALGKIEDIVHEAASLALTAAIMPKAAYGRALEANIILANDDLIQLLNKEYSNKDKPTNVLSFATLDSEEPPTEGILNLGDIFLAYETIARESQEQGKFILDHVKHLTVHGMLHLLGYDHETEEEATDMETLEIRILERLDVQNPYTET